MSMTNQSYLAIGTKVSVAVCRTSGPKELLLKLRNPGDSPNQLRFILSMPEAWESISATSLGLSYAGSEGNPCINHAPEETLLIGDP